MFGELANLNTVLVKLNKNPYLPPKLEANQRKIVPSRHDFLPDMFTPTLNMKQQGQTCLCG